MPATIRLGFPVAFAFAWLTACPQFPEFATCSDECMSTSPVFTTGEPPLPTSTYDGGGFQTVTGVEESTGTGGPGPENGTFGTTTGESIEPPAIVKVDLLPNLIQVNGPIAVTVSAAHTDGVTMVLENGDKSELKLVNPGLFTGAFDVVSALPKVPEHYAWLTPWRDGLTGEPVKAPYTVALPEPGSQLFWEASDELGPGQVVALGVLPDGQVVEFGTHFPNGGPRCYLRRRDKKGVANAVAFVLEGSDCSAVDMKIDADGEMFVLVNRSGGDGVRWWYGRSAAWGKGVAPVADGMKDETAVALALHPSGKLAVCGYVPTPATDDDAMVQIFQPNALVGEKLKFDHKSEEKPAHWFSERTRDCVFRGDALALIGEAYGWHALEKIQRDRLFILDLANGGKNAGWTIAPQGVRTQSGAQAVDVDDEGRLVVAGYTCDDICLPEGDLRIYDAMNSLTWQVSLGAFQSKDLVTKDLAWSPAGYAVVATGGLKGAESLFTVRAFGQSQVPPLWSFTHKDIKVLDLALALAIGHYGEVYAGGMAVNGYPAVAYIGG